jgi:hypothetical protein
MVIRILSAFVLVASVLALQQCKPVDLGTTEPVPADTTKTHIDTTTYSCSGKSNCSAMTSCAEARFYLQNCPFTNMDGDGDGIPCEDQWCGH